MSAHPLLVKQAMLAFRQGNYAAAKVLYQKAAQQYGEHLFKANLYLCDKYAGSGSKMLAETPESAAQLAGQAQQQLQETQQLLEHYYQRCQELEYQRLER
ncbi:MULTISPECIES: hypothetical protein [unclassified Halomonas]|uniref:hypothetical protein n=1 Tax=unclassified Halomonas TaxID=2609666 RepID=UPI001EF71B9C|nr:MULTISPECIES: hypothetical protein [unclassified Halomonas]MCG7577209.1 hypothetical protein [Halomonas sp. MMH1-48]MCG7604274.1 hypothetical protein [Halomonas sp. MM17-34]MCG7613523.1 hypothetical protein [Halomonas sp. MM17-29]MCG7620297.1 hypothetical protein [Halomonas sp. DSH1-27]|tara:strand:- start:1714 stop:2013 length:300 start_codon:yes stop_codon:yes gene_type:complete